MNNKEYLLNLLNYNSWANDEFFKVIIRLSSEEINKQRKSFMNSIRNSLNHLLVIDKVWLTNMKKEKHTFDNLKLFYMKIWNNYGKKRKKKNN